MVENPRPTDISKVADISLPYASQILSGKRIPPRPLAIYLYRKLGWRCSVLDGLTDEQLALLEEIEPYQAKCA